MLERSAMASILSLEHRVECIKSLGLLLQREKETLARDISLEMGKPLQEAKQEIDKCSWLCDYYAACSKDILQDETLQLEKAQAIRRYAPLGAILGIMPWNFPYWQVFRFAVPAFLAGNRVLVKHAPNCPISAIAIEKLWHLSGVPLPYYQNLRLSNKQVAKVLADRRVHGVSLTGSETAGQAVASIAGENLKPSLLELGGNNAFILHESADLIRAAQLAASARLLNAGQSCIAAKRILIPRTIEKEFLKALALNFATFKVGNPLDPDTNIGPLARRDLAEKAMDQLDRSIREGGNLFFGGKSQGCFVEPTIVTNMTINSPLMREEVFAPIAAVMTYKSWDEAVMLSNSSDFGLGVSLIGEDVGFLLSEVDRFEEGAVFINELVKSDPRLPFGGVKKSGYGRELGPEGLISFTNLKTIYINTLKANA